MTRDEMLDVLWKDHHFHIDDHRKIARKLDEFESEITKLKTKLFVSGDLNEDDTEYENYTEIGSQLIRGIYEHEKSSLDGWFLVGFNSKKQKEDFIRGMKYGISQVTFFISEYFGLVELWEKLNEDFRKLKVDIVWPDKEIK